jgi:hypothetical protein
MGIGFGFCIDEISWKRRRFFVCAPKMAPKWLARFVVRSIRFDSISWFFKSPFESSPCLFFYLLRALFNYPQFFATNCLEWINEKMGKIRQDNTPKYPRPGADSTITSYNSSVVKNFNSTNSIARFWKRNLPMYKRYSLLQHCRCSCELKSRRIGSRTTL